MHPEQDKDYLTLLHLEHKKHS